MSFVKTLGMICGAFFVARAVLAPSAPVRPDAQKLTVSADAERIVIAWSGPIASPMRDTVAAAITSVRSDPRRLVISLNSPGGSIGHGREVMAAIREAARGRAIDTRVEKGAACASMCVPIFLMGARRTADPGAHFMFHEAQLNLPKGRESIEKADAIVARKWIATVVTNDFYETDFAQPRVNVLWLREMRTKIENRDVWLTAQQLVEVGSGVVDALIPSGVNQTRVGSGAV